MRFASLPFISLEEKAVLVILVLVGQCFRHGQRLMDRLDDVLIVGLDETTQDFAGFLWTNADPGSTLPARTNLRLQRDLLRRSFVSVPRAQS
jgi:hypothetical protein